MKAAVFGAREAFKRAGRARADPGPVSLLPNGGKMLLGTDIAAVLCDARGAEGRRDRPQLLDRPGGHARRDPLPRRALPVPVALHPERRACRCRGPTARRSSPSSPSRWPTQLGGVRRALRRRRGRRLLRHDARRTSRPSPSASAAAAPRPRPARRPPPRLRLDDRRDRAAPGARGRRWSASASTRRARAGSRSCCSPTTTTGSCGSPRTRSRAARMCSTSASR